MPYGSQQRKKGIVAQPGEQRRTLPIKLCDKPVDRHFLVRHTGKERAAKKRTGFLRAPVQAAVNAPRVLFICPHGADLEKRRLIVPIAQDRGGAFFLRIAFKYAAQQPLEAAVILINDLAPRHFKASVRSADLIE